MGKGTKKREHAQILKTYRENLPFVGHASRSLHSVMGIPPNTQLSEGLGLPWHLPIPSELAEEEIRVCADEDVMDVDQKAKEMSLCKTSASEPPAPAPRNGPSNTMNGSSMNAMNALTTSTLTGSSNASSNSISGSSINSMNAFTASALSEPGSDKHTILRQGSIPIQNPFLTPGDSLPSKPSQNNTAEGVPPSSKRSLGRLLHFKQLAQQNGIRTGAAPNASTAAQSKELNKALRLAAPPVPAKSENATLTNAREQLKRKYKDFQSPNQDTTAHHEAVISPPCDTTTAPSQQPLLPGFQHTLAGPLLPTPAPANQMQPLSFILANGFRDTPPLPTTIPIPPAKEPRTTLALTHKPLTPKPIFLPSSHEHWNHPSHHRHRSSLSSSSSETLSKPPSNWTPSLPETLSSHTNNPRVHLEATTLKSCVFSRANDAKYWNQVCNPALGVYPRLIRIVLPALRQGDVFVEPPHRDWLCLELVYPAPPRRGRPPKVPKKLEPKYLLLVFPTEAVVCGSVEKKIVKGKEYAVEKMGFADKGRLPLMFGVGRNGGELRRWMTAFEKGEAMLEVEYAVEEVRCWI